MKSLGQILKYSGYFILVIIVVVSAYLIFPALNGPKSACDSALCSIDKVAIGIILIVDYVGLIVPLTLVYLGKRILQEKNILPWIIVSWLAIIIIYLIYAFIYNFLNP